MDNILIVNVNWVGDAIFSIPVFKAIKQRYPRSFVACLCVPRVRDILEDSSYIDEVIVYDEQGKHKSPWGKLRMISQLRRKGFSVAFLLHGSLTRALLVFLAGIPVRVGYATKNRGRWLTHPITVPDDDIHRSDHYLGIIEAYGIPVADRTCDLNVSSRTAQEVDVILEKHGVLRKEDFIVINPGGNWDLKRWPPERFSTLLKDLSGAIKAKVVLTGAESDKDLVRGIVSGAAPAAVALTGALTLKQLAGVMQRARLVVSADSGPLHIADGVGTPTVALFGPTRPEVTGPRGKGEKRLIQKDVGCNKAPCYYLDCPDNICMKSITAEEVMAAVIQKLS